jgi:hypothetical protein
VDRVAGHQVAQMLESCYSAMSLDLIETPLAQLETFQTAATSSRHELRVRAEATEDIGFSQRSKQCNQKLPADGKHPLKRY